MVPNTSSAARPRPIRAFARVALALAAAALPTGLVAQSAGAAPAPSAPLTIQQIMATDWIGTFPENPYWGDDGKSIYFTRKRPKSAIQDLVRVELASGRESIVPPAELAAVDHPGVWSADRRLKAWIRDGDVWFRESGSRSPRQITRTSEAESAVLPLSDGRIAFRRDDHFLAFDPKSGRVDSLADIRFGDDPEQIAEPEGYLGKQQRRLFTVLSERADRKLESIAVAADRRRGDPTAPPRPFYFEKDHQLVGAELSPSGRKLFVAIAARPEVPPVDSEDNGGGKPDEMPRFVTDSGYVEIEKVRPKVGTGKPVTPRLFVLDLVAGSRLALDLKSLPGLADDPLAELRKRSAAANAAPQGDSSAAAAPAADASPRAVRYETARWSDEGGALALQLFTYDNKDRYLLVANLLDGTVYPLHTQRDPAWLGWRFTDYGWMRDSRTVWYLSEASGFSHLFLQSAGGAARALTQGPFEVDTPVLSRDGSHFFVSANREQAGTYEAYRVSAKSGGLERLTTGGGMTYAIPSPDEKQLLLTSSWATKPPELYVQAAREGAPAKRLTKSTTPQFDAVSWSAPEIVQVPSTHFAGAVQARVYMPPGPVVPGRPAVLFTHGAGYLQNAHAGWSSYYREFMFHSILARAGYVVLDMDYRASSGYGRDHRTAIYRQMGWPEVEDLEDGVAWLVANRGVERARIGTYGGSYGGFLTFMSMFRKPELFAAGAALRPVTDWAHYNNGYTSAILNSPEVDPEAFDRSSPIEYAAGLAKPLLICHGMVDDNVTFQDTVRLVQRLIELGKTDLFETAIYPVEPHAFKEASSWTDEYRRIFNLFEEHLK